jgi:predicted 3-demethylubiquinone-9 3-methyltransferase (glyoxalase superfamily)
VQTITPFLWFNDNAEQALQFYCSVFEDSQAVSVNRMGDGKVVSATFRINGQNFFALNGGPAAWTFNEAVSFMVNCDTQQDVDELWEKLSAGGSKGRCGWLKDQYGLSWQIVPALLATLLKDPDPDKRNRVMQALMQMNKIDGGVLRQAYDQRA